MSLLPQSGYTNTLHRKIKPVLLALPFKSDKFHSISVKIKNKFFELRRQSEQLRSSFGNIEGNLKHFEAHPKHFESNPNNFEGNPNNFEAYLKCFDKEPERLDNFVNEIERLKNNF